ncbi:GlxA family transcriptional regulator [Brevibacterium yomogidense]|uniref:Transcriptional regulator containing an amidase domain and an AraC-type DNA-binding HTH domain n=1 Tax=Brevibacterium yomogidense TaxID=946573 RepID=A0A1X6WU37_9MICO|nr:helix-turn-helix domain-containing protein [Brevibacterium yomogidense]SLM88540.1 Transcriptional regulator containing an amidase domain and an AraC-type DNA-binding HTH domain [Brevibacterium yomogidense]
MTGFTASERHRIAVLVRPGVRPMELGLIHQLFGSALSSEGAQLYEVLTCTPEPGTIRTNTDFAITVEHGTDVLAQAHTVVVPAAQDDYAPLPDGGLSPQMREVFARLRPGVRIASVCTGAFVLAAAGLLDGRRATTHWSHVEEFRALHPAVELLPDVLYVDEGEVLTSAGEAAGIDMCLHMIRNDHGTAVAKAVARTTVVPPHRDGGQAQYIRLPVTEPTSDGIGAAREWALENLHRSLSLQDFATQATMSVRTFTRRFRAEIGMSARQWLIQQRTERARELLEDSDLPIDEVSERSGFGTSVSLRQHFRDTLNTTPSAYRRTFRGAERPGTTV